MNMRSFAVAVSLTVAATQLSFSQGPLTPPGPPAPTMKSLDEVDAKLEKRTPISSLPFTISAPGSYYLTGNLTAATDADGIRIEVNNVTIDLNGFSLSGTGGTGRGIYSAQPISGVTLLNGFISGWRHGVTLSNCDRTRAKDLTVATNSIDGLVVGASAVVVDCIVRDNGGNGIVLASDGVVQRCVARSNTGHGFSTGLGAVVTDSTARQNGANGFNLGGDSTIQRCVARTNIGNGISVTSDSLVLGNAAHNNGAGAGQGAGINVTDVGCRIEGNETNSNDRGIHVQSLGNLIIRNSARGNAPNYQFIAGNRYGPIVDLTGIQNTSPSANTAPSTLNDAGGGSHPWANFAQ